MRRSLVFLALAAALTLIIGRWVSMTYAEWKWYEALGALPVYRSALTHQIAWRVGAAVTAFTFAFLNLYALRRSIVSLVLPRRLGNIEIGEAVSPRILLTFVAGASALLAILLSSPTGDWTTFALARIAEPFREIDPFLDRDLSFMMGWLPFEHDLYTWSGRLMVVISLLIIVLYALTPSLRLRRGGIYVSAWCRRHLATLAGLGILLIAWRWRLAELTITTLPADPTQAFSAYEHRVGLPLLRWLAGLTGVSAVVVFWAGWHGHGKLTAAVGLAACLGGPFARFSLPGLTRTSLQRTDEERPYASTRRLFTRRAFGVDEIAMMPPGTFLSPTVAGAPSSLPVWDPAALARTVAPAAPHDQRSSVAWSADRGGLRAAVITGQPAGSRAWTGTAFDPTSSDERGHALPALPADATVSTVITWGDLLVYPGAVAVTILDDSTGHVPAPAFSSLRERVAHAWNLRSPRLLAVESPAVRPRIVFRRDVAERVAALAPFFVIGPTITPLVRGDSVYWVAELYSTSRFYPLSTRLMFAGAIRPYVHHAATAFVHGSTGRVTLVADASPDAITRTWMRRFPWLFGTQADVPAQVWSLRPPTADWASLQATALANTGFGDRWPSARYTVGTDNTDADLFSGVPTFFAVERGGPRLAWSQPLVDPSGTVAGAVVRTTGGSGVTSWVPSVEQDRWSDVLDRLQRSADSAGVGRQRRSPRRGRVTTIPVAGGLLYLQAHYEWPTDAAPIMAGVAVMWNGVSRAGATASEALGLPADGDARGGAFRASVDALYRRMSDALRRGDWPAFGSAFNALGQLLRSAGR